MSKTEYVRCVYVKDWVCEVCGCQWSSTWCGWVWKNNYVKGENVMRPRHRNTIPFLCILWSLFKCCQKKISISLSVVVNSHRYSKEEKHINWVLSLRLKVGREQAQAWEMWSLLKLHASRNVRSWSKIENIRLNYRVLLLPITVCDSQWVLYSEQLQNL